MFALSACAEAVLIVESLINRQTKAASADVETSCLTSAVALYNGITNYKATTFFTRSFDRQLTQVLLLRPFVKKVAGLF